jgi:hypothetical protein
MFKPGDRVRVLEGCRDWSTDLVGKEIGEILRETYIISTTSYSARVYKPVEYGGYEYMGNKETWSVDNEFLELLPDIPIKPFIPYPRTCKICKSPARKNFCSNRKCKSRRALAKQYKAMLDKMPQYKILFCSCGKEVDNFIRFNSTYLYYTCKCVHGISQFMSPANGDRMKRDGGWYVWRENAGLFWEKE